jgi:hypothetical protein
MAEPQNIDILETPDCTVRIICKIASAAWLKTVNALAVLTSPTPDPRAHRHVETELRPS